MVIKSISFYKKGRRIIFTPGPNGLFTIKVPVITSSGYPSVKNVELTASDFVRHEDYRDCDPTLTLEDGSKLRVYHAGNPHVPIVHPSLLIEKYDEHWKTKRLRSKLVSVRKASDGERKEVTTQPMAPLVPPPSANRAVKVSNGPPQKSKSNTSDPFSKVANSWFGDDDDPDDGLYEESDDYYQYVDDDDDYGDD